MRIDGIGDYLSAVAHSHAMAGFIKGVKIIMAGRQELTLKIEDCFRLVPLHGFSSLPYAYVTQMSGGGHQEFGYGHSNIRRLAIQKSIVEAVERVVLQAYPGTGPEADNSNGWAAHLNRELAHRSALMELLERDSVLVHWLCQEPLTEIIPETLPPWVRAWQQRILSKTIFPSLRVMMSTCGHVPTISTLFVDQHGHGVVSHCAGKTPEHALIRALTETCRIGEMAAAGNLFQSSRNIVGKPAEAFVAGPEEQAVIFAHHLTFPSWIFGEAIRWSACVNTWARRTRAFHAKPIAHEFVEVVSGPLSIGYCRSTEVQNLFFGRTEDALAQKRLNVARLRKIKPEGELSAIPHFVA